MSRWCACLAGLGLALLLGACGGGSSTDSEGGPGAARPVAWVEGAWTQPVPLEQIVLGPGGGFGAFGAHQGNQVEGLNHIWIPIATGRTIGSWAASTVTRIENMGDHGTGDGQHEYFITIAYGRGLIGKHLDVEEPLVAVGDKVGPGQPVARGPSAEFMLVDEKPSNGERFENGSPVPRPRKQGRA